jgi:TPP-dependent pyruvate/acetoin dehydrogenase alpha subunit
MKHTVESLKAFEEHVKTAWENGELPSLIHLCSGNEVKLIEIFEDIRPQDWVFVSHRAHFHCLLKGMSEETLMENIRNDRSMFNFSKELRIYQSAILAGNCGIAVGTAMAIKERGEDAHVHCFLGDGAEESGHFYEAVMFVSGHDLPVTFHIEDNDIQVDTPKLQRRGMERGLLDFEPCVQRYLYTPHWPHAGSGSKYQITFKRTHPLVPRGQLHTA